ncbi:class I SAM-dependent methyltransferase [Rhizobium laguerreae]|uniref:class I SAM-dependent methyltransferase n=1 Tax=Rhizobium laguerreae TaxID=1076926 RepID=UPI001FD07F69|nr:class I SAM-dependent methyltransferase [Rhizobium laguerreae]
MFKRLIRSIRRPATLPRGADTFNCGGQTANSWMDRANISAELIAKAAALTGAPQLTLADIGCGDGKLAPLVASRRVGLVYRGFDLHPQRKDVTPFDLRKDKLEDRYDVISLLGVLEYISDLQPVLRYLRDHCRYLVVSHVSNRVGMTVEEMAKLNWTTVLSKGEFSSELIKAGFSIVEDRTTANGQTVIWLCEVDARKDGKLLFSV